MNLPELSTFIKVKGSLNERVYQSTGLPDTETLLMAMKSKLKKRSVDFLIPSYCQQNCTHCFFQEEGGPAFIQTNNGLVEELRKKMALFDKDKINLTIYPREITQAMNLLPVFAEKGQDRVLTNGLTLCQEEVIDRLQKNGIKRLAISLHGFQDDQNCLTGGTPEEYQKIIKGIKKAITSDFDVSIFTTVSKINIDSLPDFFTYLSQLGLKEIKLIRLTPTGNAKKLTDNTFLDEQDVEKMLDMVNGARILNPDLRIALFASTFGPNFYSPNIYEYLSGQKNTWPNSTYLCPWVEQEFVGISLTTGNQYPCYEALSFPETQIGIASTLSGSTLEKDLQGNCNTDNCQYQKICMGGCRITAFSFAKRRNDINPLFAGQDICLTRILDKYAS